MMRDLVGAESCGVANPLANLGNLALGGQGQDVRTFGGGKQDVPHPTGMAEMMNSLQPAMRDPVDQQFINRFEAGQVHPSAAPFMAHYPSAAFAPPVQANSMVADFQKMGLSDVQPHHQQQWAHAFHQQQMQQQHQQQHHHQQQQQHHHQQQQGGNSAWAAEFKQAHMQQQHMHMQQQQHMHMQQQQQHTPSMAMMNRAYTPQMSMMGPGMPSMLHLPMMFQPPPQLGQMAMPTTATATATATAEPVTSAASTVQQPVVENAPQVTGGGMGMDKATVDALMNSDNPKFKNSKFLKFIDKIQKGEIELKDNQAIDKTAQQTGEDWAAEFDTDQAQWMENFEQDFSQSMGGNAESFLKQYQESQFHDHDWAQALQQANQAHEAKDPVYSFAEQNNYTDTQDPYSEGLRLLREGKLRLAIAAFEAATQQNPDNAEAWRYLGQAQAENENEQNAIAALLKCISIDPYNLPALLMLGVSYTNDLEERRALNFLKTWMLNNPDYQGVDSILEQAQQLEEYEQMYGGGNSVGGFDGTLHEQVTSMYLKAAESNPKDADVHTVLGVLYHISNNFDKAIEAFSNAVKCRPDDPTLWNKLGATQANSGSSSDATHAYKRALQIRPTYVRALANLAIAFANQGMHEDAARTYLATLKQNPTADHVWSYLRISLSNLGKADLVKLTESKDVELFRPYYRF